MLVLWRVNDPDRDGIFIYDYNNLFKKKLISRRVQSTSWAGESTNLDTFSRLLDNCEQQMQRQMSRIEHRKRSVNLKANIDNALD